MVLLAALEALAAQQAEAQLLLAAVLLLGQVRPQPARERLLQEQAVSAVRLLVLVSSEVASVWLVS
ncbi:hypothetical protein [Donghicola eburneus]|uniref:hypothetical protein n=1 Tax=Donghicola eburneus TaxID=393278 RepID=UPI000B857A76|nr:hypothetical protein [Donghicola eburneus]